MLTPQDDLLGHQTPATFAHAGNGDPRFTERYWYSGHPVDGSPLILDIGFGYYPNRGVMDAFAGVTIGRRQFNFRASRRLGARPLETEVGPLCLTIDLRNGVHHLRLVENASGIAFDLRFEPSFPAAREKQSFRERDGRLEEDLARIAQFGRWRGWLAADGQHFELTPDTWWGQRDRSWGIRSEMRTDVDRPPVQSHSKFFWTWSMLQMQHSAVSIFLKEREPGAPYYLSCTEFQRGSDGNVVRREATRVEHNITWANDPLGQTISKADLCLEFEHGPSRELRMEGLPARYYLKGGLYGGLGGWNHGDDRGEYHEGHDIWSLDDPAARDRARTLSDHVMRVLSGSDVGIGISEYGVAQGYPRYPAPQKFPAL
jgi:hypothetical protein